MTRIAVLLAAALLAGQGSRDIVTPYVHSMGFVDADVSALNSGQAVAKPVTSSDPLGVALFGAIRVASPADTYIQHFRNIESFERGGSVSAIGRFHDVPSADDMKELSLEPAEVSALRNCRSGSCDLQLSVDMMNRMRSGDTNAVFRVVLLDVLSAYRKGGISALGAYDDQAAQTHVAADFRMLLNAMRLPVNFPELTAYLNDFPKAQALAKAEDFFYWSKVEFGLKPTVRLNHVTIYPLSNRTDGIRYVIAIQQLYASHYFSTTLEVRVLVDDRANPGKGFYLLDYSASRVPGFASLAGALASPVIRTQARTTMEKYLAATAHAMGK